VRATLIVAVALVGIWALSGSAGAGVSPGRLSGVTEVTFGCPGPIREGAPPCRRWLIFPRAHFTVTRQGSTGSPIPGTRRLAVSDGSGRFDLALAAGSYQLTPQPQARVVGGTAVDVTVLAGRVTRTVVRFWGLPRIQPLSIPRAMPAGGTAQAQTSSASIRS
jgi:hypothetical protein